MCNNVTSLNTQVFRTSIEPFSYSMLREENFALYLLHRIRSYSVKLLFYGS
jgi:hypothetical protein